MITDVWGFGFKDWLRVSGCKGWGFRILGLGYQGLGLDFIGFLGLLLQSRQFGAKDFAGSLRVLLVFSLELDKRDLQKSRLW